jgi:hypothetical protein
MRKMRSGSAGEHQIRSAQLRLQIGYLPFGTSLLLRKVAAISQSDAQLSNGRFDVVVDSGCSQQTVRTSLIDANSSLGCQVMTAPSNTVEFQGATHAVVGHGAVLEFEPTTCLEALGEIRTQLTGAMVQIVRTD